MSVICNNCGAENADAARFCAGCGSAIGPVPSPSTPPPPPPPGNTSTPTGQKYTPAGGPLNPSADAKMLTLWATIGVVSAVLIGIFFWSRGGLLNQAVAGVTNAASGVIDAASSATSGNQGAGSSGNTAATPAAPATIDPAQSYNDLVTEYAKIGALGDRIGANGGSTGFVKTFNNQIGGSDSARSDLRTRAEALYDEVAASRAELESLQVSPSYEAQKSDLLALYDLLIQRIEAMRDAAEIAVNQKASKYWLPTLQPKSKNARKAYEAAYPLAEPTQQ